MAARHALCALLMVTASLPALAGTVTQTNLTSDGTIPAAVTDPNLKNPWGISYAPGGAFWVSDNNSGLVTLYSGTGAIVPLVVTVPSVNGAGPGSPTGQVFTGTSDFVVNQGGVTGTAVFLFATEDGTISGWAPKVNGGSAIIAVDQSAQRSVFKGLALYTSGSRNYLLATDFRLGLVEVFDGKFGLARAFRDPALSLSYAPYNVAVLNGNIYVTYAEVDASRHDSLSGIGKGVVEEVSLSGHILARARFGSLDAPWGLAVAPPGFSSLAGDILVGNFGNGTVSVFTPGLKPQGRLDGANGKPLSIRGLWSLIPGNGGGGGSASDIYFSAGPNHEKDGLFGSLSYNP